MSQSVPVPAAEAAAVGGPPSSAAATEGAAAAAIDVLQRAPPPSMELFAELWEIVFQYLDPVDIVVFSELCKASWHMAHSMRYRGGKVARLVSTISRAKVVFAAWPTLSFHFTPITSSELATGQELQRFWRQLGRLSDSHAPGSLAEIDLSRTVVPLTRPMAAAVAKLPALPNVAALTLLQRGIRQEVPREVGLVPVIEVHPPPLPPAWLTGLVSLTLASSYRTADHGRNVLRLPLLQRLVLQRVNVQMAPLPELRELTLEDDAMSRSIGADLSKLECPKLERLTLRSMPAVTSLGGAPAVRELVLERVDDVVEIPDHMAGTLRRLTVADCPKLCGLKGARNAVDISICGADALTSVSDLMAARSLRLKSHRHVAGIMQLPRLCRLHVERPVGAGKAHGSPGADGRRGAARAGSPRGLCQLEELTLQGGVPVTPSILAHVTASPTLHTLRVNCPLKEGAVGSAAALMRRVQVVDLSGTDVDDVAPLSRAVSVTLRGCRGVTNVAALGSVAELDLRGCTALADASALTSVRVLDLSRTAVAECSTLGGCHALNLADTRVTDVSALGAVYRLNLSGTRVEDISALGGVSELLLDRCFKIADFGALRRQVVLHLGMLPRVTDAVLQQLTRVRVLHINGCMAVTSVGRHPYLRELNIEDCVNIRPVAEFMSIARLRAKGCGRQQRKAYPYQRSKYLS